MVKVFILQAQGFGDDEMEFVNIGAYSSMPKLNKALKVLRKNWAEDDLDVVTRVETYTVDA